MAERFSLADDSVQSGVRRIARALIAAAIDVIDAHDLSAAEKVHEVRKRIKTLRALLRLIRPSFGDFFHEDRAFRDIARRLSGARDAQVLVETFDTLVGRRDGRPLPANLRRARSRLLALREEEPSAGATLEDVRLRLLAARERAAHWTLDERGWDALADGLEETYRRARRAMHAASRSGNPAVHHDWRKRVKHHADHARLLRAMKPHRLRIRQKRASRLADLLGQRHDIDVFLAAMSDEPASFGDVATVTRLASLARLRIVRLDRQARKCGAVLFDDKPKRVERRWRRWWKAWDGPQ